MTSSKSTKRALLTSVLAILMCVTMLIGTTFAWFTDSASTAVNKIQAGNLKVDLEMKNSDDRWVSAKGQTLEFKKATDAPADEKVLWEPGCTYELPQLRVVNKGNLAFKYKVIISGVNGNAKLLEAIDFFVKIGDAEKVALADWDGILLPDGEAATDTMDAGTTSAITISGTMKKEAGNEYQGLTIDGIGITVVATQAASEYDSFNNTYDTDATYLNTDADGNYLISNANELVYFAKSVNVDGETYADKTVKLTADIDLAGKEWAPIGTAEHPFSSTFDGNGKTISNLKITAGSYAGLFGYVSTATIKNVKLANADVSGGERMASLIGRITDDATVTNCSNDDASSVTGSDSNTGGLIGEIVNGTVTLTNLVNNAAVENTKESNSRAGGVVAQVTTNANVTLTNCTNNGAVKTNNGYAGGIVSAYQSGSLTIDNCANTGALVGKYKGNMLGWYTSIRSITISSDTTEFDIDAIGCIDIATTSDMSLYGKHYFVNKKADLTGVGTTAQTFSEIFAEGQIGTSPKALWDKLIAFYAFAAKTNSNFAGYPKDYWSMFNQHVGYSEPDWDSYFDDYNAQCGEGNKLQKSDFTSATWRDKIVYLAPSAS